MSTIVPTSAAGERAPERHAARLPARFVRDPDGRVDSARCVSACGKLPRKSRRLAGRPPRRRARRRSRARRARPSARARLVDRPACASASTSQNEQARNAPSSPAEPSRRGSGRRTAPCRALARTASIVAQHPLAPRVAVAEERQRQQARVELAQVGRAHVARRAPRPSTRSSMNARTSSALGAPALACGRGSAPRSASVHARSSATQQSAFDWMKCVGARSRTSQMPESGSRQSVGDVVGDARDLRRRCRGRGAPTCVA